MRGKRWSNKERKILTEKYPDLNVSKKEIEKALPDYSWKAIKKKASRMKLKRKKEMEKVGKNEKVIEVKIKEEEVKEEEKKEKKKTEVKKKKVKVEEKNIEVKEVKKETKKITEIQEKEVLKIDSKNRKNVRIGFMSRIDYGSSGFRKGLIVLATETFKKGKDNFVILAGGLVSYRALKSQIPKVKDKEKREEFLERITKDLAMSIPEIRNEDGKLIKIHIVTSPAYDGWIGEEVAKRLAERREDIRHWKAGGDKFPIKYINKTLWVLVPKKAVWMRGDYYSTPVERVIKDKQKQSSQELPDFIAVGGFGSSIHKPQGEAERPYISLPALCRLEETTTSENQIGVVEMEYIPNQKEPLIRNYNFKDLVSQERNNIDPPKDASDLQKKIIEVIKEYGPVSIGVFSDVIGVSEEKIIEVIKPLMEKSHQETWSGMSFDKSSERYGFNMNWLQEKLHYSYPEDGTEDSMVLFSCPHSGSIYTDYKFIVDYMPEIILKRGVNLLVGAGDWVIGLAHDVLVKGEVYGGFNETTQEQLAAYTWGTVILKVFKERFEKALSQLTEKPSLDELKKIITEVLVLLVYIPGNHDEWSKKPGFTPLTTFRLELLRFLTRGIEKILKEKELIISGLMDIVETKIIETHEYQLSSGLTLGIFHPNMARTKTTSIRPQEVLNKSKKQINVSGNFHVAEVVLQWEPELGQRIAFQIGTLLKKSDFEEGKLKTVDFGVGFLRIRSLKGRIFMTETAFYGVVSDGYLNNEKIFSDLLKKLGIDKWM